MKPRLAAQFTAALRRFQHNRTLEQGAQATGIKRSTLHRIVLGQLDGTLPQIETYLQRTGHGIWEVFPDCCAECPHRRSRNQPQ